MTPLLCLATAIFFEAGIENYSGKLAVGTVVINRVEDHRYPNTICDVVFEKRQFSFTHDGKSDKLPIGKRVEESISVAKDIMAGKTLDITSTHYHTVNVKPYWRKHYEFDGKIGRHLFYTNETDYR